jgi:hypothetical protein
MHILWLEIQQDGLHWLTLASFRYPACSTLGRFCVTRSTCAAPAVNNHKLNVILVLRLRSKLWPLMPEDLV